MRKTVIRVENVSKQYRLGQIGTGSLAHDINRFWYKVRGKDDPYLKIGEENDRGIKGNSDYVWALENVSFDVKQGDVLGIIGRNGAGKSTLLKILSRTTTPTTGSVKIRGRVASLLEVGTGFHPELTGRDNIFLNGAILGMTKNEIKKKFDEIVDFAGVERYIDTPVKRYSSGMYVRLAFAVAAHLEPEILIVDEVLAVGDAEFQKKCLGKMKSVSDNDGRTVLFVSHNMQAIKQLCNKGALLHNGKLDFFGGVNEVAERYLKHGMNSSQKTIWIDEEAPGNEKVSILQVAASGRNGPSDNVLKTDQEIIIEIKFRIKTVLSNIDITWDIFDMEAVHVCHIGTLLEEGGIVNPGIYSVSFVIPGNLLNAKRYYFNVLMGENQRYVIFRMENILSVDVEDGIRREGASFHQLPGAIHPKFAWIKSRISS